MRNRAEWAIAFLAAIRAGGVPALVNSRGAPRELRAAIEDVSPAVVLADDDAANIIDYNHRFYDRLGAGKEFVVIRDSDHNFGFDMATANEMIDPSAGIRLVREIDRWLSSR